MTSNSNREEAERDNEFRKFMAGKDIDFANPRTVALIVWNISWNRARAAAIDDATHRAASILAHFAQICSLREDGKEVAKILDLVRKKIEDEKTIVAILNREDEWRTPGA